MLNLVNFLRQSVIVQDPNGVNNDPDFLEMTDEELRGVLEFALLKVNPNATLDTLANNEVYLLLLHAKKELYSRLAVKSSPLVTIGFGDTALKYENRFEHYLDLIKQVEKEIEEYNLNNTTIESIEILLDRRYYTQRSYELSKPPIIKVNIDTIRNNSADISWLIDNVKRFYNYVIYVSQQPILDLYSDNKISQNALKVTEIFDIHNTYYRISNLQSNTKYYVLVIVQLMNGLKGYAEVTFTTNI